MRPPPDADPGTWLQLASWSRGSVPFAVFRRPLKSPAAPLQLPAGAVVDLEASGTDQASFVADLAPITLMFSPNGSLDRVYESNGPGTPVTEPIYLLIGRRERVTGLQLPANPTDDEKRAP